MSNFFTFSDGNAVKSTGTVEIGGFELIPEKTTCEAMIVECGWTMYEGEEYINAKWQITKPVQYANRVIFQKIRILEKDAKKRDNALRMFAAIDQNATGGKIVASGESPSDESLFALINKPMLIKIMVWEMNDRKGNWISEVKPRTQAQPQPAPVAGDESDVPF